MKKITVVGIGYVGVANAILLAQKNQVTLLDIVKDRVDLINRKESPISDKYITKYLSTKKLNLKATMNNKKAYKNADYIIVATPTNYDSKSNYFDTSLVELVIGEAININQKATIIIKSTIPVGFTKMLSKKYSKSKIIFSPEFLREGKALYDNLYPSRIVIGSKCNKAKEFAKLLTNGAIKKDIATIFTNSKEAESIKLFANTYLAIRVAFFNELDTYGLTQNLNTKDIIEALGLDPRIGNYYNNPSFGYGGYCLPKDTKQLDANYNNTPHQLIHSVIESNSQRKKVIAKDIVKKAKLLSDKKIVIGIYRLTMKSNSDNFRESSIQTIINILKKKDIDMIIYEPFIKDNIFNDIKVIKGFKNFQKESTIIVANRITNELEPILHMVYSRDIFRDG